MNTDNTLIGRTDNGKYWYFDRHTRVVVATLKPGNKRTSVSAIHSDMIRVRILRMRFVDRIGCVKFFEVGQ